MKMKLKTNCSIVRIVRLFGLRSVIAVALCAVGFAAVPSTAEAQEVTASEAYFFPAKADIAPRDANRSHYQAYIIESADDGDAVLAQAKEKGMSGIDGEKKAAVDSDKLCWEDVISEYRASSIANPGIFSPAAFDLTDNAYLVVFYHTDGVASEVCVLSADAYDLEIKDELVFDADDFDPDEYNSGWQAMPPPKPSVTVDALSNVFALDLTAGDRIAADEETLVVNPAWGKVKTATVELQDGWTRTYTSASNDLWQTAALAAGRYTLALTAGEETGAAAFWKTGDDWVVFDSSNITADVTFEAGKTYLFFGTNTVDATLTVTDGAKFVYDESAPAGFLGGDVDLPKRYEQKTVGDLYQIVEKIKGCEDNPWEVGGTDGTDDLVTAWTNGTELVISGEGTITNLADIAKGGLKAITISKPTVTGAAKDAFAGVGGESEVKVTLPDGWQGELPDKDGKLYGMKVDMTSFTYPTAVKNVEFLQRYPWNGLVDIACDLTGSGTVELKVTALTNDVKLAEAKTIIGETTIDLGAAGGVTNGVKLIWNAANDLPAGFKAQNVKVKVTVEKAPSPEPVPAGQLWAGGPIWAEANFGTSEVQGHPEYGALYTFDNATNAVAQLTDGSRLPTKEEFEKLIDNCDSAWNDAKKGYTFTGKGIYSSNSIFLPAAGYEFVGSGGRFNAGDKGIYWSATPDSWEADRAYSLDISKDGGVEVIDGDFGYGSSVRTVKDAAK